jgi:hypothetical protein
MGSSPGSHLTYVEMNKIGSGIVSNPSGLKVESRPAKAQKTASRKTNVNGLSEDVKAMESDFPISPMKIGIGGWASIAGDDVKGFSGVNFQAQSEQEIQKG